MNLGFEEKGTLLGHGPSFSDTCIHRTLFLRFKNNFPDLRERERELGGVRHSDTCSCGMSPWTLPASIKPALPPQQKGGIYPARSWEVNPTTTVSRSGLGPGRRGGCSSERPAPGTGGAGAAAAGTAHLCLPRTYGDRVPRWADAPTPTAGRKREKCFLVPRGLVPGQSRR